MNILARLMLILTTNWVTEPITVCTNACCRDKWPQTVRQYGVVTTNVVLLATNQNRVFRIKLREFERDGTPLERTVPFVREPEPAKRDVEPLED